MQNGSEQTITAFDELRQLMKPRCTPEELERIKHAYEMAERAHFEQVRSTGEPYITHPLAVAGILAYLKLDPETICAALLHDTVEDTMITLDMIQADFGKDVAHLVNSVTKLSKHEGLKKQLTDGSIPSEQNSASALSYRTDREAESVRKMMLGLADDIRVVLIKLADRLHNMRTLDAVPLEKQKRIARETLEIFAPLANRLGIWEWKQELEDLGFRYGEPSTYGYLARMLEIGAEERENRVQGYIERLRRELANDGVVDVDITGRAKQIYSIWRKMQRKNASFDQIRDAQAIRVIIEDHLPDDPDPVQPAAVEGHTATAEVPQPSADYERTRKLAERDKLRRNPAVQQCYTALGVVHGMWHPIPGEFDDYISVPKDNQYRSLHTAVVTNDGTMLEVQIRTLSMHKAAEFGVAAHWLYKESSSLSEDYMNRIEELRSAIKSLGTDAEDARSFVDALKNEHFKDTIYCFTPKGKLIELPNGSTVLDFAYHVHTEIGHKCRGAKINGVMVPLRHRLKNGEQVDVLTRPTGTPSRDWIHDPSYMNTPSARAKVKGWFRKQDRTQNVAGGRETIERELKRLGVESWMKLEDVYKLMGIAPDKAEDFLEHLGYGIFTIGSVASKILEEERRREREQQKDLFGTEIMLPRPSKSESNGKAGWRVEGVHGLLVSPSACCNPLPGDEVVGYITVGSGVKVHRKDCKNVQMLEQDRMLAVTYEGATSDAYPVQFMVKAAERPGMLNDLTTVLADRKINILGCNIERRDLRKGEVSIWLMVELSNATQVSKVLSDLNNVTNVFDVRRVVQIQKRGGGNNGHGHSGH